MTEELKTYWVLWTYVANYSRVRRVQATSPHAALERVTAYMSADFKRRACIYVWDSPPLLQQVPEEER